MGRRATKAADNVWYQARMEAALWNDRLSSRAGASELLNVSEDVIKDVELSLNKCMPVETAVRMADLYNAPHLLNHYCLNECPIGCRHSLSDNVVGIERVTVKLLKNLRVDELTDIKNSLIDIAEDGRITDDEKDELQDILNYLDELAKSISELKIIGSKALRSRAGDADG